MAKKKNKKQAIAKKKAQRKHKKIKKRKIKYLEYRRNAPPSTIYRPAITDMEPPPGFRPISVSQAIHEYSKPIFDFCEPESLDEANLVLQTGMALWNYANTAQRQGQNEEIKDNIVDALRNTFDLSKTEARSFLDRMVARFEYLFPRDIQPAGMVMFIRKEGNVKIEPFNYESLSSLSPESILPCNESVSLITALKKLDSYLDEESWYDKHESLLLDTEEKAEGVFYQWLRGRSAPEELAAALAFCIPLFVSFCYQYNAIPLKRVSYEMIDEFFSDFLLRKMLTEPQKYVNWPPAIKLFYRFLQEMGYLEDPSDIIGSVDNMELEFMKILKRMFEL